ncbi:unnamed protein product [Hymenolepis diminuta]|uniref:Uncharacterized protein n=1 Tax=Hymenolepis diminuta TaxID=6216 RepID=A0A564YQF6_HYMDI|nr:unnamed protein product [Hymenolepis diminuta]
MRVAETQLTWRCFGTSLVHTISSFSYNSSVQLKHTYKNINGLQYTHKKHRLSLVRHIFLLSLFSTFIFYLSGCPHCLSLNTSWSNQLFVLLFNC